MHNTNAAVDRESLRYVLVVTGEAGAVDLVTQLRHTNHISRLILDGKTQNVPEIQRIKH